MDATNPYLIYDIEIVFEGCSTYRTEIVMQDIAERLQERECNQRVG